MSLSGTGTAPGPVLSASPASLSFPSTDVGSSAATQTVTVTNTGTTAATVSSVAVTGAFSQTNNCTTIAVNGTCTVTVKFTPTAATNTGTLTVNSNANNTPLTVGLSGAGITSTTNIALNQPVTASSDYESYVPANVTDGNTSTYWESTDGAGLPADHHGRPGLDAVHRVGHARPAAVVRLEHPDGDAVGPRQHQRLDVQPARRVGRVHLQPVHRQHGDDQPAVRHQRPLRGAELHRQHRLVRRSAVGVRGLPRRREQRRRRPR